MTDLHANLKICGSRIDTDTDRAYAFFRALRAVPKVVTTDAQGRESAEEKG
jgi:hypothetical protein